MIEIAIGHYPYPPETYANVFAQLTAIVHGDPPELPDQFSDMAKDFASRCLQKNPQSRATYSELLVSNDLRPKPIQGNQQDSRNTNGWPRMQPRRWILPDGWRRPWNGGDNNGTPNRRKPINGLQRVTHQRCQSHHHTPSSHPSLIFDGRQGLILLNPTSHSLAKSLSIYAPIPALPSS